MQRREDPTHFRATCPALELKRKELLESLPPALKSLALIPDTARDPIEFTATLLGIPWIGDTHTATLRPQFKLQEVLESELT